MYSRLPILTVFLILILILRISFLLLELKKVSKLFKKAKEELFTRLLDSGASPFQKNTFFRNHFYAFHLFAFFQVVILKIFIKNQKSSYFYFYNFLVTKFLLLLL